ncbi:unnamed protein product [Cuscuta campestris]|uniref:Replication protein A subunit n=1 Tax=Cuscuta campestris TaxID=132261 RepID=A0A484MG45_9ASTE|nr:unnamed protein product [Cuscuta campestris]
MKLKAILQASTSADVISGAIQNLGLIRILDYTLNDIPMKNEKYLIVTKCEAVSPSLEAEYKVEVKREDKMDDVGIALKPKQDRGLNSSTLKESKSAAQIVHEQNGNMAPPARMAMTRRVHPLISLNPYQGVWTIKVCVTNKGNMRFYKNARGEGCVFNVELTDQDGTQIQATMFNEAAKKFYDKFELGKMYYISKGTLKVANKQFKTVQNDYEMTLNDYSIVEEASDEPAFVPETKFNFIPIDELGPYVNSRELVDVIGVVQSVSPTMSIRRKSNNEMIPKRDITIADETKKTVVVSLWGDLATNVGQELLDTAYTSPVVAIKSLKVGDFQGVSLSALSKSTVLVNPDLPKAKDLRSWFDTEGKETSLASVGAGLSPSSKTGSWSLSERVSLLHITSNSSLGEGKPVFFRVKATVSFIKPDQAMWYRACKTCNKKVTDALDNGYWCESCQKNDDECVLRYIMVMKVSDASGEAWMSVFNDQAEQILRHTANELDRLKSQDGESTYMEKLKEATWVSYIFQVSVAVQEYNSEKKQRITVRGAAPVDYAEESKYLFEEMAKMNVNVTA